jgi:hypothetical protein
LVPTYIQHYTDEAVLGRRKLLDNTQRDIEKQFSESYLLASIQSQVVLLQSFVQVQILSIRKEIFIKLAFKQGYPNAPVAESFKRQIKSLRKSVNTFITCIKRSCQQAYYTSIGGAGFLSQQIHCLESSIQDQIRFFIMQVILLIKFSIDSKSKWKSRLMFWRTAEKNPDYLIDLLDD